jgi:ABC-type dipeptide/oligopeptide/nickel transport system permease subunit
VHRHWLSENASPFVLLGLAVLGAHHHPAQLLLDDQPQGATMGQGQVGIGTTDAIIAVGIYPIPTFARIARGSTFSVREQNLGKSQKLVFFAAKGCPCPMGTAFGP